jgi:hypothetical protein
MWFRFYVNFSFLMNLVKGGFDLLVNVLYLQVATKYVKFYIHVVAVLFLTRQN